MSSQQIARLGMQAALRTLDLQQREVEQLRLRSGVLLAACSLIASIFGGAALKANHGLGASGVVALAALAVSTSLCVYLLLVKRGLIFDLDAEDVYEHLLDTDGRALKELIGWLAPLDAITTSSSQASIASSHVPRSASWSKWSLGRSCSLVLSTEMQSPERKRFDPGPPPPGLGRPEIDHGPSFLFGKPQSWDRPAPGTTKRHGLRALLTRSRQTAGATETSNRQKRRFDPGPPPPGLGRPEIDHGPSFLFGKPQSWDRPAPGTTKGHGLRVLLTRALPTRRRVEHPHR